MGRGGVGEVRASEKGPRCMGWTHWRLCLSQAERLGERGSGLAQVHVASSWLVSLSDAAIQTKLSAP